MNSLILTLLFNSTSAQFGLPQGLLSALCYVESTHKVTAVHKDDGSSNSVGICQIKLITAKGLGFQGTEKQLMEPKVNIYYAAKYLAKQRKRYGSITRGIIAYNRGNAKGLTRSNYSDKVTKQWRNAQNERHTPQPRYCSSR